MMTGPQRFLYERIGPVSLYLGDAAQVLAAMPAASVDCVVTSLPYWGLRDYGTGTWTGGNPACSHTGQTVCKRCGAAWADPQQGLEPTVDAYISRLVAVFSQVARVLKPAGTVWLNLGDAYTSPRRPMPTARTPLRSGRPAPRKAPKQLLGVPWRTALALQDDGWILRNAIVWAKTNPMPSSVKDRFTTTYEHLFLLTRSQRYWFDLDPVRIPLVRPDALDGTRVVGGRHKGRTGGIDATARTRGHNGYGMASKHDHPQIQAAATADKLRPNGSRHTAAHPLGRNPVDVWALPTRPYHGAHVAPFPIDLPLRAIAAGCPPSGVVCDPYSGAATTGLAALRLGRSYIGIDIDPGHHRQALRRMGLTPADRPRRTS